jgi:hypothetical protein
MKNVNVCDMEAIALSLLKTGQLTATETEAIEQTLSELSFTVNRLQMYIDKADKLVVTRNIQATERARGNQ